ncbi:inactive rhomboid protein 1-like [Anastrepha ludens]|uniref:inactive rhomboid protein 1-like n=1 Tax=Anastrepha ludens TaxID=28586 RepID=UPI0023AF6075|nr:inactive rhomboid protein 1-like [Anastrepha ludens]XP_053967924.1 inactive rhomboid protein 1-like [Anastrepha ludens]
MITPNASNCCECDHHIHHHAHHTATAASQTNGHGGGSNRCGIVSSNVCSTRCRSMLGYHPQLALTDDGDAMIGVSCSETSSASGRYSPHPNELFQQHHGKLSVQPITGYDDTSNCCLPPPSPAPNSDRYIMSLTSPQTQVSGLPNNVNCLEMHTAYTNYDGDVGCNKGNANGHIHQTTQSFSSSSPTSPLDVNGISKTTLTPKYVSSLQECSISPNTRFRLPERIREVPMPKSLIMTSPSSVGSQPAYASTAVTSQPSSTTRYVSSTHFLKQNTPLVTSDTYTYLSSTVHTPVKRYVPTPPPPNELYSDVSMQPTPVQQTSIKCGANINMVGVSGGGGRASTHHGSTLPYRFRMKCCTNESQPIQTTNTASSNLTHNLEHRPLSLSDYYGSSPQTRSIFVKSSHNSHSGRNSSGSNSGNNVNDNTNGAGSSKTTTASGKDSSTIILHDQQMQINGHSSAAKVHGTTSWIFSSTLAGSAAMATSVRTSTASSVAVASDNGNGTYVVGGNRLSSTNTARINKAHVINDYIQRTPSIEYINATATAAVGRLCTTTTTQMEPSSGRGTNSSTGMSSGTGSATTCLHCNTVRRTTGVHQTTQTTGPISPIPLPQMMDGSSSGIVGMNSCNSGFLKNVLDQTSLTLTPSTSASHISPLSPSGTYHSRILFPNKLDDDNLNGIEQMQHQQGDQIYLAPKSQPQPKNFVTQGIITEHVAVVGNSVGGQQQQHQAGDSGRQLLQQSLIQSQQTSLHQPPPPSPLQKLSMRRFPRKKRFSQYIRKEIARFFGIDARTEAEEFAVWQGRQRRLALRRFGALKCESELHAEIINNNPGEASNRLNCYGATGGTNQQNHNYHYHHSERPDILPTHDTENNGLPIEYSTRRCHFVYADFQIADNVERKASVSAMIISSLNYIVYSLNRRQPRNYRQWSRSFAPAHLNNINDIVNSSDVFEGLSALQEDEMFFDSTGTEQIVANENSNGGNSYIGAVGGVMRTEGPNKPANNGVKMIEYHRQIYMGERVHGWRTSAVMSGNTHCTTNNEQGIAAVLLKPASKISGTFGGQQPSNDGSYQSKKSGNVAASLPNVQFMNGTRGDRISPQLLDGVLENSRRPIQRKVKLLSVNDLDDRADHRLFFTYWINTVQIVVLLLSLICYGIGPVGIGVELKTGQVLVTSLSLQTVQHMEQRNVWIGPRNNDLVHMGAKFAICMRSDVRIMDVVLKMRRQERETACCIRNDDSGCVQSSQADCSVRGLFPTKSISTWKKWSPGDSGPGGRISGSVCGLDPKYCDSPASIAPYEWPDDITKWPICRKTNTFSQRFRYKDNTAEHMACEVIGHPCCTGAYGECRITTREYCDFVNGFFHEEASLCSQ